MKHLSEVGQHSPSDGSQFETSAWWWDTVTLSILLKKQGCLFRKIKLSPEKPTAKTTLWLPGTVSITGFQSGVQV